MADLDALRAVPLFSGLDKKALKRLGSMLQEAAFSSGEEVAVEGDSGSGLFFLIDSGEASVSRQGEVVNELGPGDWFGELALIARSPRTATVTATTDLRCRTLASFQFRPFVQEHADVAWPLLESLVKRIAATESG